MEPFTDIPAVPRDLPQLLMAIITMVVTYLLGRRNRQPKGD